MIYKQNAISNGLHITVFGSLLNQGVYYTLFFEIALSTKLVRVCMCVCYHNSQLNKFYGFPVFIWHLPLIFWKCKA